MANFNAGKFWTSITKLQETCILSITIQFLGFVKDFQQELARVIFELILKRFCMT